MNPGRIILDARSLQNRSAVRGIGSYVRGLLGGLASAGAADRIDLLLARGKPPPDLLPPGVGSGPRVPAAGRWQPLADPLLLSAALARAGAGAIYHAVEWGQPAAVRIPVVITVHDLIPFLYPDLFPRMRRTRLPALHLVHRADAVIVPSSSTARDAARVAGVDWRRITVIPHGLDPRFRPPTAEEVEGALHRHHLADTPFLLLVGVLDPHKRLGLALEVLRILSASHPSLRLVVAGDQGFYRARIEAEIAAAGLSSRVVLVGHIPAGDLPSLYRGAGCVLHTSAYEGFGLPLLEAMACGAVLAAVGNSSVPEVVGPDLELARDGDSEDLARLVTTALQDPADRALRVAAGLSRAAAFDWRVAAEATLGVYAGLAK